MMNFFFLKTEMRRMVNSSLVIITVLMVVLVMDMMLKMSVRQGEQVVVERNLQLEEMEMLMTLTVSQRLKKIGQQSRSQ